MSQERHGLPDRCQTPRVLSLSSKPSQKADIKLIIVLVDMESVPVTELVGVGGCLRELTPMAVCRGVGARSGNLVPRSPRERLFLLLP